MAAHSGRAVSRSDLKVCASTSHRGSKCEWSSAAKCQESPSRRQTARSDVRADDGAKSNGTEEAEKLMYPPPNGVFETDDQAEELDDTFLSSDPLGYFTSRIAMLHHWASNGSVSGMKESEVGASGVVAGRPEVIAVIRAIAEDKDPPRLPNLVVSAQVAVDALVVRHHLAEAVLRLFVACVEHTRTEEGGPPMSVWARLTDDRLHNADLVDRAQDLLTSLVPDKFFPYVLPPTLNLQDPRAQEYGRETVQTYGSWLFHAMDLLKAGELDTNAAHNKVKHGLAARGRADYRLSFSLGGPNADGNMEAQVLNGKDTFDIFTKPVLEFLARPPKEKGKGKGREGLEVTQLQLDYRRILTDAIMFALVHGALFHVAAHRHFAGRELPTGASIAPHPGLMGDAPMPNHGGWQVGMRFPITLPEHGGTARPMVLASPNGDIITLNYIGDPMRDVLVVDANSDTPEHDAGPQ